MRTLARAVGSADIGGEPLPSVFRTFEAHKIILRRAEVSMIAGTPGAGKSTLALAMAWRAKVPTLYVSADTNAHTMAMRLLSMITGKTQSDAEEMLVKDITESRKIINDSSGISSGHLKRHLRLLMLTKKFLLLKSCGVAPLLSSLLITLWISLMMAEKSLLVCAPQ